MLARFFIRQLSSTVCSADGLQAVAQGQEGVQGIWGVDLCPVPCIMTLQPSGAASAAYKSNSNLGFILVFLAVLHSGIYWSFGCTQLVCLRCILRARSWDSHTYLSGVKGKHAKLPTAQAHKSQQCCEQVRVHLAEHCCSSEEQSLKFKIACDVQVDCGSYSWQGELTSAWR